LSAGPVAPPAGRTGLVFDIDAWLGDHACHGRLHLQTARRDGGPAGPFLTPRLAIRRCATSPPPPSLPAGFGPPQLGLPRTAQLPAAARRQAGLTITPGTRTALPYPGRTSVKITGAVRRPGPGLSPPARAGHKSLSPGRHAERRIFCLRRLHRLSGCLRTNPSV